MSIKGNAAGGARRWPPLAQENVPFMKFQVGTRQRLRLGIGGRTAFEQRVESAFRPRPRQVARQFRARVGRRGDRYGMPGIERQRLTGRKAHRDPIRRRLARPFEHPPPMPRWSDMIRRGRPEGQRAITDAKPIRDASRRRPAQTAASISSRAQYFTKVSFGLRTYPSGLENQSNQTSMLAWSESASLPCSAATKCDRLVACSMASIAGKTRIRRPPGLRHRKMR